MLFRSFFCKHHCAGVGDLCLEYAVGDGYVFGGQESAGAGLDLYFGSEGGACVTDECRGLPGGVYYSEGGYAALYFEVGS